MAGEPLITVIGNLVADPEPRVSQAGKSWCTFRIASTPRVRDRQSGDWSDGEALWLGCRAFGEYADNIVRSLTKGARVIVQGRLTQRSYTDNQGQQRTSLDLEVEEIGPALRWASAQVQRGRDQGQGGFGGQQQAQGQNAWGAAPPQQGQPQGFTGGANPWTQDGTNGPPQGQQAPQAQQQGNPWPQQNAPASDQQQPMFGGGGEWEDKTPF